MSERQDEARPSEMMMAAMALSVLFTFTFSEYSSMSVGSLLTDVLYLSLYSVPFRVPCSRQVCETEHTDHKV
jgi:hypothetical protein